VFANDLNPSSYKYLQTNIDKNKVGALVRASCEDGREFIRNVVWRAAEEPFPAYTGPPLGSRAKKMAQRKLRAEGQTPDALQVDSPRGEGGEEDGAVPSAAPRRAVNHFVMNLPDSAITFLDAFRGVLSQPPASPASAKPDAKSGAGGHSRDLSGIYDAKMPMVHCHCFTRELEFEGAERDIRQRVEAQIGHPLGDETSLHLVRAVAPNKHMYCISFRLPRKVAFA
jgi:tRNA (guanine37-N1)-methyltransferase